MAKRLFVDMDGTLAEWRNFQYDFTSLEEVQNASKLIYQKLNEEDYFYKLKPQENVVNAIKEIVMQDNEIEVYILSAAISDKAIEAKNRWLDEYIPEIDCEHRIYTEDGKDKKEFVVGGVKSDDYLLDDRTLNLTHWQPPAKGIKLLNGVNHTTGTWKDDMLNYEKHSLEIAKNIVNIMNHDEHTRDEVPRSRRQTIEIKPITELAFADAERWRQENEELKAQYIKIIGDEKFRAFEWETDLGAKYIFHPSTKEGYDWQLSFIDHNGIPFSDSQWKNENIGKGGFSDVLTEFPHSSPDEKKLITALFDNHNGKERGNPLGKSVREDDLLMQDFENEDKIEGFERFLREYRRNIKPEFLDDEALIQKFLQETAQRNVDFGEFIPYEYVCEPERCNDDIGRKYFFEMGKDENTGVISITYSHVEKEKREVTHGEENKIPLLAAEMVDFLENHDPAFGYAESLPGQENKEQWIETIANHLYDNSFFWFTERIQEIGEIINPEVKSDVYELLSKIKTNMNHFNNSLETRYVEAMKIAGYQREPTFEDDFAAVAFKDIKTGRVVGFDDWQLVGDYLENVAVLDNEQKRFESLIHPKSRMEYYTTYISDVKPVGEGTGANIEHIIHSDFNSALASYSEATGMDEKKIGIRLGEKEVELARYSSIDGQTHMHNASQLIHRLAPDATINELDNIATFFSALAQNDVQKKILERFELEEKIIDKWAKENDVTLPLPERQQGIIYDLIRDDTIDIHVLEEMIYQTLEDYEQQIKMNNSTSDVSRREQERRESDDSYDWEEDLESQMQMAHFVRDLRRENANILSKNIELITQKDIETFSENEFMIKNTYSIQENGEIKDIVVTGNMREGKIVTSGGEFDAFDLISNIKENNVISKEIKEAPFTVFLSNTDFVRGYPLDGEWVRLPMDENELRAIADGIAENGISKTDIHHLQILGTLERSDCGYIKDIIEKTSNVFDLNVVAGLIGEEVHPAVQTYVEAKGMLTLTEVANLLVQENEMKSQGIDEEDIKEVLRIVHEHRQPVQNRTSDEEQDKSALDGNHTMEYNTHREDNDTNERNESMEEKTTVKDDVMQRLKDGIEQTLDSKHFANWCKKQGKLYYNNYSLNNALLTYLQNPDASYVCGYETWKNYGRQVRQGAQSIKVLAPVFVKEYGGKGSLLASIKKSCNEQFKKDPSIEFATYRLGQSKLSFNMYKNGLFDVKINDDVKMAHITSDEIRKFLDQSVIGKVPTTYNAVSVFDISDTTDNVEFLWVSKDSCKKDEMVLDDKGNPVTNRRGQVQITNSEERKSRFKANIEMELKEQDAGKMQILYETLQNISNAKGIPMMESEPSRDETLAGGALGYYRHPTSQYPLGNIVIGSGLSLTDKVAVSIHEIAHSDMHRDLNKLKAEMGTDVGVITKQMKEVQAEAVAYMTASTFGIETEHKSFAYIANWSDGRELKSFENSLDVIYKESRRLLKEIETELDVRGFDMSFEIKDKTPLTTEEKKAVVTEYKDFIINNLRTNETTQKAAFEELRFLDNEEQMIIVKEQIALTHKIEEKLISLNDKIEKFEKSHEKQEQMDLSNQLRAEKEQIKLLENKVNDLSLERIEVVREMLQKSKEDMKQLYASSPMEAMKQLQKDFSEMQELSDIDLKYLANSTYVSRAYSKYLGSDNERFVTLALKQLENFNKTLSKNNTVVEIPLCEQWGDEPIFVEGTLVHPKEANKIIASAEKQIRAFKEQAEKQGEYYPYAKCNVTVYSLPEKGRLTVLNTRIDIGDKEQNDLTDHLTQVCKNEKVLENYLKSTKERSGIHMLVPYREQDSGVEKREEPKEGGKTSSSMAEWRNTVNNSRQDTEEHVDKNEHYKEENHEKE